ncbi:MAG: hypothetical protein IKL09_01030, partial [Clostridia bacterium]|nr:hypothetical protein [Clostridia bacterium]
IELVGQSETVKLLPEFLKLGGKTLHYLLMTDTVVLKRADSLYEVAFDTVGTKKLMTTFAKLKKKVD